MKSLQTAQASHPPGKHSPPTCSLKSISCKAITHFPKGSFS